MVGDSGDDDRDQLTNDEVSLDMTGEAEGMNLWEFAYLKERSAIFNEDMIGGREKVTTNEERVLRGG